MQEQSRCARGPAAALIFICAWFVGVAPRVYADAPPGGLLPGAEIMLPEDEVEDRFFAYLIGLAGADAYGRLTGEDIARALGGFLGKTRVPFELITEIERRRGEPGEPGVVRIAFTRELKAPVPYSILGYNPGSVRADTVVTFYEWYLPRRSIRLGDGSRTTLTHVHVFGTVEGWAVVDIDAWVDLLLGGRLDDTWLVVMGLFKYEGDWYGIAAGYGPGGEGRSGVLNFRTNKILFPTPDELKMLGPYFRNFVRNEKGLKSPPPPYGKWSKK